MTNTEKIRQEIERRLLEDYNSGDTEIDEVAQGVCAALLYFIDSLQQEQPDYKEAVQLVFEEELTPFKDGNQWCFLLGRNIQDGICGFGDTILDAAVAFYKDYMNTKIHTGELKISMAQQEQPKEDLEKEYTEFVESDPVYSKLVNGVVGKSIARHFYELGLNARKEE